MHFFPRSEKSDSYIARSIIDLALSLKSEENKSSISIPPRNDNLNNKASELKIKEICLSIDIYIAYQFNSSTKSHQQNKGRKVFFLKFSFEYYLWHRYNPK